MKQVDLFRHTDNDGDRLTTEGVAAAERIGREALNPPYDAFVSSGAARATQMLEILRSAVGQDDVPITEQPGLRSSVEDRWRGAAKAAGKGADLEKIRTVDPDLVEKESMLLGRALKQVMDDLPDGGRTLVVGHSPTNEAAVLGLAAIVVPPMGKGDRVVVIEDGGRYRVEERPG
jgi:phosphohistidine phosphatase SixA